HRGRRDVCRLRNAALGGRSRTERPMCAAHRDDGSDSESSLMAKILVVDDSALSRRISRQILEGANHEVVEAADGIAALERYFLEHPDLVMLDITMKGMSGFEVLQKLREL